MKLVFQITYLERDGLHLWSHCLADYYIIFGMENTCLNSKTKPGELKTQRKLIYCISNPRNNINNGLLDLQHNYFSFGIYFCLIPSQYHNALQKVKCYIIYLFSRFVPCKIWPRFAYTRFSYLFTVYIFCFT